MERTDNLALLRGVARTSRQEALEALEHLVNVWDMRDEDHELSIAVKQVRSVCGHLGEIVERADALASEEVAR